jgi:hypothetical protein
MKTALKLQFVLLPVGAVPVVDVRGGEPNDQHKTIAEADPANTEIVEWLLGNGPTPEGVTNGEMVNRILSILEPSGAIGTLFRSVKGSELIVPVLRVMDGDDRI